MEVNKRLRELIAGKVIGACDFPDAQRDRLLDQIHARYGPGLLAILIYGSYLRGKRDTLLDFYVLLDDYRAMSSRWQGWLARALPPNVYQIHHGSPPDEARAKYALLTLDRFEYAVRSDFHSYFWARFAQPCGLLYCRDEATRERVVDALCQAASTFARRVVPSLGHRFGAAQLWSEGLTLTYQCELRSEPPGHARALFDFNPDHYRDITSQLAAAELGFEAGQTGAAPEEAYLNLVSDTSRRWSTASWWLRRIQGKVLSVLRIFKSALTFDDALDYLLWKIGRHSGVYLEPSHRQRKYPLLFAWPLLWRLYRRGAFR
jgi:hypothetical protein